MILEKKSIFEFAVDERECIVVCGLHPTKYFYYFFYRYYLTIIIMFLSRKLLICLNRIALREYQSGKRLHNITVGCGDERDFYDFGPRGNRE